MGTPFVKNNIQLINGYIDNGDFDSAYEFFLKSMDELSHREREEIQYAFPPKYFEKIKISSVPYYECTKQELEKGDPTIAYEIYLNNVKDSQKKRMLFLNQCFSAARKCSNIVRKAKIETIIKKILPEHQKHVDDVSPKLSIEYNEFCNELDKLYKVKELVIAGKFSDANK